MVINHFTENDVVSTGAQSPYTSYQDTFSAPASRDFSFYDLFARTTNSLNNFAADHTNADHLNSYQGDANGREDSSDVAEYDPATVHTPHASGDDGIADDRNSSTIEEKISASDNNDLEKVSGKDVADVDDDVDPDQQASPAVTSEKNRETGEKEHTVTDKDGIGVHYVDSNRLAKQATADTNETSPSSTGQAEALDSGEKVAKPEPLANTYLFRNIDQEESHTTAKEGQSVERNSDVDSGINARSLRRVTVSNGQPLEGQDVHSDGQSEQQHDRRSHSSDPVRIAVINRNNEGHQQHGTNIREQQYDSNGLTKTVNEFRQFLQREISPSVVKHARFVFHNDQESEVRILLKPAELGVMRVKLFMQNNAIHGKIVVDSALTRDIVENNLVDLQKALRENGLQGGEIDVSLNSHAQSSSDYPGSPSTPLQYEERMEYEQQLVDEGVMENNSPFLNSALIDLYA